MSATPSAKAMLLTKITAKDAIVILMFIVIPKLTRIQNEHEACRQRQKLGVLKGSGRLTF
jgi:hypothetical protein